jgi:hypothetical protein
MGKQTKPKIGRPKLPKGEAKGRIVPVRFSADEVKRITDAASAKNQKVSEWIRGAITTAMEGAIRDGVQIETLPSEQCTEPYMIDSL